MVPPDARVSHEYDAGALLYQQSCGQSCRPAVWPGSIQEPPSLTSPPFEFPKAIVFDVFGTVVDWRGTIIEEGTAWGKAKGVEVDWGRFADRWRAGYRPAMD